MRNISSICHSGCTFWKHSLPEGKICNLRKWVFLLTCAWTQTISSNAGDEMFWTWTSDSSRLCHRGSSETEQEGHLTKNIGEEAAVLCCDILVDFVADHYMICLGLECPVIINIQYVSCLKCIEFCSIFVPSFWYWVCSLTWTRLWFQELTPCFIMVSRK